MGLFSTKSAWGKQMASTPTNKQRAATKAQNAELRRKRAAKKKADEIKRLKREEAKRKVSKGFWG